LSNRPLSDDLFNYARADTHFLLYIFDNMRNELIDKSDLSNPEKDKIADVLEKSRETALQRYEHPIYDTEFGLGAGGWYRLITRTPVQYTPQQFAVFRAVHKWRDDVARAEDESPLFILPNHAVFSIARTLPTDRTALFSVIQHVSHMLRVRADELVGVIAEAKAAGSEAPDLIETIKKIEDMRFAERAERAEARAAKITTESIEASPALEPAPLAATLETPPLRAPASSFWGSLWSGGPANAQRRPFSASSVSLALPLPPLTAEVFTEGTGVVVEISPAEEKPEHAFVPKEDRPAEDQRTDIFIVKQLGGKRKRAPVESPVQASELEGEDIAVQADEVMLDDAEAERQRRKQQKKEEKARKKELKRQEALQQSSSNPDTLNYDDEPAFDYASAPSVLRARDGEKDKSGSGKKKREKKKSQGFNPYGKMADAPKGLPRTQKEAPGRSKTFKS
jgi:exosome complex exonuclease RRP6